MGKSLPLSMQGTSHKKQRRMAEKSSPIGRDKQKKASPERREKTGEA
jgi:hypothetical protein